MARSQSTEDFDYDVFISYSHRDEDWVHGWLLPRLEDAGLKVCIDFRDFEPGAPSVTEMERAVETSRKTVLVLTPDYLNSEWAEFENLMLQTLDPAARKRRLLPLMLKKCKLPLRIRFLNYLDFTREDDWNFQFQRLVAAINPELKAKGLPPRRLEPYFAHVYPLQEHFTGRARERQMLTEWFTGGRRCVLALIAIGGMGKSALTWVWLHRDVLGLDLPGLSEDPPEVAKACGVPEAARPEGALWWSFYEREAKFAKFLDEALSYAGGGTVDPKRIPSAHDKVRTLVGLLQQRPLLLVLDGFERELRAYAMLSAAYQGEVVAEDARGDDLSCTDPHAALFLSRVASLPLRSRVLLTSRLFPRELEGLAGCRSQELSALDKEDAVAFFRAQGVRGTRAEIQAACAPYGYHPLALRLLAGVIVRDKRMPGDVQVASRYPVLPELKGKEQHHILQVAYDALDGRKRALLSRVAAFRSSMDYDTLSIFNTYKKAETFDAALDEFTDRGLMFFDPMQRRYDLHPIVRQYAYDRLADKEGTHTRLRDYFAAVPEPEEMQSLEDLAPVIELYHHTVRAGRYDEAFRLYRDRLGDPLYFRFGVYQTCIELLRALFPDGEDHPPGLKEETAQAWTLNDLAASYSAAGLAGRAIRLLRLSVQMDEDEGDRTNLAIDLGNLASQHMALGELAASEENMRRRTELCREIEDEFREAIGHSELGRLLAYRAAFDEAANELETALASFSKWGYLQSECVVWAHRALRALLMGDAGAALKVARRARKLADEVATTIYPVERDYVRAEWLLGAALVALASEERDRRDEILAEAEGHLTEALNRCRRINVVDDEPDILLTWARWHRARGSGEEARSCAEEALAIADRCEYRLKQAEIHNFLSQWELDAGHTAEARKHAEIAKERALCDGPPHCYQPALQEAERLLEEIAKR